MKKFLLAAVLLFGMVMASNAGTRVDKVDKFEKAIEGKVGGSVKAAGIRLGYGVELFYQHEFQKGFVQLDLGFPSFLSVDLGASYNWMIAQPKWTSKGEWGFYAGPGAAVGFGVIGDFNVHVAVTGQVGLEYTFWFPLKLSVDLRPQIGVVFGDGVAFHMAGLYGFVPTITAAYRF